MGRKITLTGKNARYIEHRGADATPDSDREILMEGVSQYVKRLRRRAHPTHQVAANETVPDIVLSLLGAGEPVAEDDLNAREAHAILHGAQG